MNNKLTVFRIDRFCFIIFIPYLENPGFLRIGDSKKLSPFFKQQIDKTLLTNLISINFEQELRFLKRYSQQKKFIALPSIIKTFQQHFDTNNKDIVLDLITTKLDNSTSSDSKEENQTLKAIFYKNNNVKSQIHNNELFDLSNALSADSNEKLFEKALKEFYAYSNLYINRNNPILKGIKQYWELNQIDILLSIMEQVKKNLQKYKIEPEIDQICFYCEGKKFHIKNDKVHFFSQDLLENKIKVELDHSLNIGEIIELKIENKEEIKLTLPFCLKKGLFSFENQNYLYMGSCLSDEKEFHEKSDLFCTLQNYAALKYLIDRS